MVSVVSLSTALVYLIRTTNELNLCDSVISKLWLSGEQLFRGRLKYHFPPSLKT